LKRGAEGRGEEEEKCVSEEPNETLARRKDEKK
jgi:hypothetical protein